MKIRFLLLRLLAVAFTLSPRSSWAINLLVYNTNDSGSGTLRQAVSDNKNLGGGNTIVFSNVVTGTITLTTGELLISNNVTILGPGANVLAVNGNAASRVFNITNSTVTITGLTITNGFADSSGGGISSYSSTLTLSNCTITGNMVNSGAGGILNQNSALTVNNCTISGNSTTSGGGGIENDGFNGGGANVTVIASTLSGNSASTGGGIANGGYNFGFATVTIIASTLSSNSAANGGGIFNSAVSSSSATLTVSNCTLSGNSASADGGGIYNSGFNFFGTANVTIIASTLSGNSAPTGGGIFSSSGTSAGATLEIGDTILKAGASGANIFNSGTSAIVTSDGYNLSSDNGGGFLTAAGDQINTDPMLRPLRDNGGPTPTMALLPGSPAIDTGKSFGLTTDQRGAPRPFDFPGIANASGGDGSDIGALELGRPTLNIQKVSTNAVLSWQSYYGDFTLQSVTNVIASNSWATVAGTPVVVANQNVLTNGPISGNNFYRLQGN